MSGRRQALLNRFKAGSLERLRRLAQALQSLDDDTESAERAERAKTIARELHTLKGESRMLGLKTLSEVAHASEELFLQVIGAAASHRRLGLEALLKILDQIALFLNNKFDAGGEDGESTLVQLKSEVLAAVQATAQLTSSAQDADFSHSADEPKTANDDGTDPRKEPDQAPQHHQASPVSPQTGPPASAAQRLTHVQGQASDERNDNDDDQQVVAPGRPLASAEPTAPAVAPAHTEPEGPDDSSRWIHVSTRHVDNLCEEVMGFAGKFGALHATFQSLDQDEVGRTSLRTLRALKEDFERCSVQLDELTESAWALRLTRVEPALEELVVYARELARSQGKHLVAEVWAGGAQLERSVLDSLWDPLVHLVRNAVDHGIELPKERSAHKGPVGHLSIRAEPRGSNVLISISDDGRGINIETVRVAAVQRGLISPSLADTMGQRDWLELLFHHGFSTRSDVGEMSGRGVGLDVVRDRIQAIGGSVALSSEVGRGTRCALTVPATISKEQALVVESGGGLYAIPARHISELIRLADFDVGDVSGGQLIRYHQSNIPIRSLERTLSLRDPDTEAEWAMIVDSGQRRYAFTVDHLVGEFEVLRRPLDPLLTQHRHLAASAVLDDGRLVLICQTDGLIERSESTADVVLQSAPPTVSSKRVLVVDDSPIARDLVTEILRGVGLQVQTASDGQAALALIDVAQPDLVLSDVEMPVMGGFELLRRIRLRTQRLPVVMLTTRASADDRRRATELGADGYLIKSDFQEATLVDTVHRFLGTAS